MLTKTQFVQDIAASAGMAPDLFLMIIFLYVPLFTAPIYRALNSAKPRAMFDIVVGSALLIGLYGFEASIHFYALSVVSIVLIKTVPQSQWVVYVVAFTYLGARHAIRFFYPPESYDVEITGPMMVLVLKVISMGFRYAEGGKDVPNFLLTLGYICHHATIIVGPVLTLDEYLHYGKLRSDEVPSAWKPCLIKLVCGLFWFACHVKFVLMSDTEISMLKDPEFAYSMSFLERVGFFYWTVSKTRIKFYAAWLVSESAMNLAGWGYNPSTDSWGEVANVHPLSVEMGENSRDTITNWNIRVSEWLRKYVMERFKNRDMGTMAAFCVSAVWHGFSDTQYLFFFSVGVYNLVIAKNARRAFRPIALSLFGGALKPLYDIAGIILHMLCMNFLGLSWANSSLSDMWLCMKHLNFFGLILLVVSYVASVAILSGQRGSGRVKKD